MPTIKTSRAPSSTRVR